jgi:hypothetical protein
MFGRRRWLRVVSEEADRCGPSNVYIDFGGEWNSTEAAIAHRTFFKFAPERNRFLGEVVASASSGLLLRLVYAVLIISPWNLPNKKKISPWRIKAPGVREPVLIFS